IVNSGRKGPHSANGSNIQNTSLPLPNHLLVNRFRNREEAAYVSIDHFVPGAVGGGGKVIAAIDCSIVDQNVYAAPFLNNLTRQFFQPQAVRHRNLEVK